MKKQAPIKTYPLFRTLSAKKPKGTTNIELTT